MQAGALKEPHSSSPTQKTPRLVLAAEGKMWSNIKQSFEWMVGTLHLYCDNKRVAEAVFWKSLIHHFLLLLQVHEPCPVQCKVENLPERISEKDEVICSFQYLKKKKKDRNLSWMKFNAVFSFIFDLFLCILTKSSLL